MLMDRLRRCHLILPPCPPLRRPAPPVRRGSPLHWPRRSRGAKSPPVRHWKKNAWRWPMAHPAPRCAKPCGCWSRPAWWNSARAAALPEGCPVCRGRLDVRLSAEGAFTVCVACHLLGRAHFVKAEDEGLELELVTRARA